MKQFNLTLLLAVLMSMVGAKASAYDIAVENADSVTIYYNFINDSTELEVTTRGQFIESYKGKVVIPESVAYSDNTYKVTSIGAGAFEINQSVTEVVIPNSVRQIKTSAFESCSRMTSVTLGNSVETIGNSAFRDCGRLTEITFPSSLTHIGNTAFWGSGLTSVTIGDGVTYIGKSAFCWCFNLTSVTISNSVTHIDTFAFEGDSNISTLTIGNSVTRIDDSAFRNCDGLTEVTIPDCVTEIGSSAFEGCDRLEVVSIGSGVTSIGGNAFRLCPKLYTLYSHNATPPYMAPGAYDNFTADQYATAKVYVPQEALTTYQSADEWEKFLNWHGIDSSTAVMQPNVKVDEETITVYTLEGRTQTMKKADVQSLPSGIYIVNGQKVVVK